MASLLEQLSPFDINNDIPQNFLNVLQELYHDGRLTSWKVRGQGDILSVRLTWIDPDHRNTCIKAKSRQHLGEIRVLLIFFFFILVELDEVDEELDFGNLPPSEWRDSGWFSYANSNNDYLPRIFFFFIFLSN